MSNPIRSLEAIPESKATILQARCVAGKGPERGYEAMPVYIINNMTIHDRAAYDNYLRGFMAVFRQFNGEILAAQEAPSAIEGEWPFDRTVLLRFPSRADALAWSGSPQYQAIAKHRHAGTCSNVVLLDGIAPRATTPG